MRTAAKVREYGEGSVWTTRVARDLAEQIRADAGLLVESLDKRLEAIDR